jgi:hypothetical protein
LIIQLCNFGEDFAKQVTANKINGVVGSNGKNIPMTPNNKDKQPTVNKK